MKKVLLFLSLMLLASCIDQEANTVRSTTGPVSVTQPNGIQYTYTYPGVANFSIVEVTVDSCSHEFLWRNDSYTSGITHWPDCKYCKTK